MLLKPCALLAGAEAVKQFQRVRAVHAGLSLRNKRLPPEDIKEGDELFLKFHLAPLSGRNCVVARTRSPDDSRRKSPRLHLTFKDPVLGVSESHDSRRQTAAAASYCPAA